MIGNTILHTYPWVIESDPVFHAVAKSFEAQIGKLVEVIDHADILPPAIFLLQDLSKYSEKNQDRDADNLEKPEDNIEDGSVRNTYLGEIPVIKGDDRSDLVLQKIVNQVIVILDSFFIHMVSYKYNTVWVFVSDNGTSVSGSSCVLSDIPITHT